MFLLFEVMDKEPSLEMIWGIYLILGIIGFVLARKNPLLLLLLLPFLLTTYAVSSFVFGEINDPIVGPAIISEAGYAYVIQNYLAMIVGTLLPIAGVLVWLGRRKRKPLL